MAWHRILVQANAQKAAWYERLIARTKIFPLYVIQVAGGNKFTHMVKARVGYEGGR